MKRKFFTELKKKDFKELVVAIEKLGTIPKRALNQATRKQAVKLRDAIRSSPLTPRGKEGPRKSDLDGRAVPASTKLEKGLKVAVEKKTRRGKSVQQIRFDEKKSYIFVRIYKSAKTGDTARAYYPASMEYGFSATGRKKFEGRKFMRKTANDKSKQLKLAFVKEAATNIEKIWLKKQNQWG